MHIELGTTTGRRLVGRQDEDWWGLLEHVVGGTERRNGKEWGTQCGMSVGRGGGTEKNEGNILNRLGK